MNVSDFSVYVLITFKVPQQFYKQANIKTPKLSQRANS